MGPPRSYRSAATLMQWGWCDRAKQGAWKAEWGPLIGEALLGRLHQEHNHCSRRPDIRGISLVPARPVSSHMYCVAMPFISILKHFGRCCCLEPRVLPSIAWDNLLGLFSWLLLPRLDWWLNIYMSPQQGSCLWPGQATFRRWFVNMEPDLQINPG